MNAQRLVKYPIRYENTTLLNQLKNLDNNSQKNTQVKTIFTLSVILQ